MAAYTHDKIAEASGMPQREMTLREFVATLPKHHQARKQYDKIEMSQPGPGNP